VSHEASEVAKAPGHVFWSHDTNRVGASELQDAVGDIDGDGDLGVLPHIGLGGSIKSRAEQRHGAVFYLNHVLG
jgi:hypothetical protein